MKKFKLKALYSLSIAFYGFTPEETQHMKEVTIENGGTAINDLNDPQCTHIVINDQEVKQLPVLSNNSVVSDDVAAVASGAHNLTHMTTAPISPAASGSQMMLNVNMSPFSNTRASIVKAEWFWASIQICCRASECLYEFTKPKCNVAKADPPNKRIKLSVDNLLSHETLNGGPVHQTLSSSCTSSPHQISNRHGGGGGGGGFTPTTASGIMLTSSGTVSSTPGTISKSSNRKSSSNNLLLNALNTAAGVLSMAPSGDQYDSPSHSNQRLSTGVGGSGTVTGQKLSRNSMSANNLSSSASLLDATTDDAMSSKLTKSNFSKR